MHDIVKDYYGCQLQGSADLKTSACCDISTVPDWLKHAAGARADLAAGRPGST